MQLYIVYSEYQHICEDNSNINSELSLLPIMEATVNLIHSLKPTVEMLYYFELYRKQMISKANDYILTE
jgi:hypothetical protein